MEGSCIEESTSSSDSLFTAPSPLPSGKPPFPAVYRTPGSLCRMGSVASVVLDSENGVEAESRKIPSASKYKGVVPQPNGRWGAQIYEKHQRVWLGTFNEAYEAAKAYDIAAQRFRGLDAVTNFKHLSGDDLAEIKFLNSHSKAEIVDMLRKHTYTDELEQANRNSRLKGNGDMENNSNKCRFFDSVGFGMAREQLFEKVVTPSDVGRLNRLVIPKQHAEKHLPLQGGSNCSSKGLLLNFVDVNDKVWRFRYSYWNSSQSFVLTKGWSRFVKEKNLKAGDVVTFQRSTGPDKQLYIDRRSKNVPVVAGPAGQAVDPVGPGQVVIRLFGVDICKLPAVGNNGEGRHGKRMIDMEWSMECRNKKKMTVGAL